SFILWVRRVQFDQLCEVYMLCSQAEHNGILVGLESICGDLKAALGSLCQLFRKSYRVLFCTSAEVPSKYKFAVALDCDKSPSVAGHRIIIVAFFSFGLFLHSDVSPKLIALDVLDAQSLYALCQQPVAFLACNSQKVKN